MVGRARTKKDVQKDTWPCTRHMSTVALNTLIDLLYMGLLLRHKYYYLPFILLLWAFLVGYSRIYVGVHYPLDVLTGFFFGSVIGWGFYKLQLIAQKICN